MGNLQTALSLLEREIGAFDNIKLQLGAGEGMTSDSVSRDLLAIAGGVADGSIKAVSGFKEKSLEQAVITL